MARSYPCGPRLGKCGTAGTPVPAKGGWHRCRVGAAAAIHSFNDWAWHLFLMAVNASATITKANHTLILLVTFSPAAAIGRGDDATGTIDT